ncbi:MAG TPA: hypothetical protein VGF25_06730 [Thermoleophilaceae bacterium]|jgi:hypothetical protein
MPHIPSGIEAFVSSTTSLDGASRTLLPAAAVLLLLFVASSSLLTLTMRAMRREGRLR